MSTKRNVSIITANSNSGSACVEELFAKYADKVNVRGVFRSEEKAASLRQKYPNLQVVTGVDAFKPDTLNRAFEGGIDAAVIVTPHDPTRGFDDDVKLTENMIRKAVEHGVKYIVYVGSYTVNFPDTIKLISARFIPSEKLLDSLGNEVNIKWTSLRGGYFMENTLHQFPKTIRAQSKIYLPKETFYPMVDTAFIGKSAAACVAADNIDVHHGKHYEMSGPELLSPADIANVLSKVLGKQVEAEDLPEAVISSMPKYFAEIIQHAKLYGKNAIPFTDHIQKLVGDNGTYEQFVRKNLNAFQV